MNTVLNLELNSEVDRTYIVGREGHIYIGDLSVSREHAELKFIDDEIYLRDLNSTNGIYLIENNKAVRFYQGYVEPNQSLMIGRKNCTVQNLIDISLRTSGIPITSPSKTPIVDGYSN
jgi:hypothetical protein